MTTTPSAVWVAPGTKLGSKKEGLSGLGTYVHADTVYASVLGKVKLLQNKQTHQRIFSVEKDKTGNITPEVDQTIIGRVTRINSRYATVSIIIVEGVPCNDEFVGIIRSQDVRQSDRNNVKINECFKPGDVIRAKIINTGDIKSYDLSTADNHLGVIYATSAHNATMFPISWCEMECPKSHQIELRKCAKPDFI